MTRFYPKFVPPVPCIRCEEPIVAGEEYETYASGVPAHRECYVRAIFGSVAHIERRCSCFNPGSEECDDPAVTSREAAKLACAAWEKYIAAHPLNQEDQ